MIRRWLARRRFRAQLARMTPLDIRKQHKKAIGDAVFYGERR